MRYQTALRPGIKDVNNIILADHVKIKIRDSSPGADLKKSPEIRCHKGSEVQSILTPVSDILSKFHFIVHNYMFKPAEKTVHLTLVIFKLFFNNRLLACGILVAELFKDLTVFSFILILDCRFLLTRRSQSSSITTFSLRIP
jgi:hypothetical protein